MIQNLSIFLSAVVIRDCLNDMRKINLFVAISVFMIGFGCSKEDSEPSKSKIVGTWIETNPELFDGISDTIVFKDDLSVKKHFYYDGWQYVASTNTISFKKGDVINRFSYSVANANEMVIYNFIDRSVTAVVKDIHFTKIQ